MEDLKPKSVLPKWVKVLIIIAIVFICLIGCVAGCVSGVKQAVQEYKDSFVDKNGKKTFRVNEVFENSYAKLTMIEVNANFTDYNEFLKPAAGTKYVMAKFEYEVKANNTRESVNVISSLVNFRASADNVEANYALIGNDAYNTLDGTVIPGRKIVGYLFYKVPTEAKKVVIDYIPNILSTSDTVEFVVQE